MLKVVSLTLSLTVVLMVHELPVFEISISGLLFLATSFRLSGTAETGNNIKFVQVGYQTEVYEVCGGGGEKTQGCFPM